MLFFVQLFNFQRKRCIFQSRNKSQNVGNTVFQHCIRKSKMAAILHFSPLIMLASYQVWQDARSLDQVQVFLLGEHIYTQAVARKVGFVWKKDKD